MAGMLFYTKRSEEINFSKLLPPNFMHCGEQITSSHKNYLQLKSWFESNIKGWKKTPVSFEPSNSYTSSDLTINVVLSMVVVNYKSEDGSWRQMYNVYEDQELCGHQCPSAEE